MDKLKNVVSNIDPGATPKIMLLKLLFAPLTRIFCFWFFRYDKTGANT